MEIQLKIKTRNKKEGDKNKMKNYLLRKNLKNNEKGITLIALVVTIIVLLILAGVAINMLRGDNGIINRAGEVRYKNTISSFDEQTKLSSIAVRTSIESNKVSKPGYIATTAENTQTLATEVAKELGLTGAILGNESNTQKISTEGYTVAYYLDTEGDSTINGNTYIVIWYTDNSLRSTLKRAEAISNYGLTDIASSTSVNQAVLTAVIHIENYSSELSPKGLTSTIDADGDGTETHPGDIKAITFKEKGESKGTSLQTLINDTSSETSNNTPQTPTSQRANISPIPTGNKYTEGQEVTFGGEQFFVLSDDGTHVKLLAKYCLNQAGTEQTGKNANINNYGRAFSTTNYWYSKDITYPYELDQINPPDSATAIKVAKAYGELKGGTGRLMTYKEANKIINSTNTIMKNILWGTWTGDSQPSNRLYWLLGTANSWTEVLFVSGGGLSIGKVSYGEAYETYGVRPVLEIQ